MKAQSTITTTVSLAIAVLSSGSLFAAVKPNPLFTDGAVLQRGQSVPVWGTASDGEKVTVELGKQKLTTTAQNGTWRVDLEPLTAGGPFTMTISGENTVTVNNLLVGEVWVCSGQSNMEFSFAHTATVKEETPKADFPRIRMFTVKKRVSVKPLTEAEGAWVECSPQTVGGFSAVGYFFAREIYQKLGVPVGMIHTSWGGTPAQAWTSIDGFGDDPELKEYADAAKQKLVSYPADLAAYQAKLEQFQAAKKTWDETVAKPAQAAMKAWNEATAKAKQASQPLPPKPAPAGRGPNPPANPEGSPHHPTALYNGMVAPIVPYGIKGAIWYQGESNAGKSRQYRTLFPAMIADWRAKWKQGDFPFLFVQIAVSFTHVGGGLVAKGGALKGFTIAGADGKFVPAKAEIKGAEIIVSAAGVANPQAVRYGWVNTPDVNLCNKEGIPASPFRTDVD